jgi:hypothetical protein
LDQEQAEEALSQASAPFAAQHQAQRVNFKTMAASLKKGSALVEFVKYLSRRFDAKPQEPQWGDWNYFALIIQGGQSAGEPQVQLVNLGAAGPIEQAITAWRTRVGKATDRQPDAQHAVASSGAALASLIWKPVAMALGDSRRVYLSPDGDLAFVSFAALPVKEAGRLVIDDFDICYVASGRDLARAAGALGGPPLLVGAPAFDGTGAVDIAATIQPSGLADVRAFEGIHFGPLPGTKEEVTEIARILSVPADRVLTGTAATETAVKTARRPSVLHLATHGFFLSDSGIGREMAQPRDKPDRSIGGIQHAPVGPDASGVILRLMQQKNPMRRSGIALAGANDTLAGRRPADGDDGLLTAEKVAGMDLWGTDLVTISACESGLGESSGGEGVYGLRRAFVLAGARHLVMSLWSVDDRATRDLMISMYTQYIQHQSPERALLAAQRQYIARERQAGRWPDPFYWAAFVASGTGTSLEDNAVHAK